jgi:hypothetical protein
MKRTISILTAAVMAMWTGVAAQRDSSMSQEPKKDGMTMMAGMDTSYTGCLEMPGDGRFTLARAVAETHMTTGSMKGSSATQKDMAMTTTTLMLSSTTVNLVKHVGRRVSVSGSLMPAMMPAGAGAMPNEPATFTVKSLKTVSGSCRAPARRSLR